MYYRVAIQVDPSPTWQWRSTVLSSLDTLFQFLRPYQVLPQDRLSVFSSSSREGEHRIQFHLSHSSTIPAGEDDLLTGSGMGGVIRWDTREQRDNVCRSHH